VLNVNSTATGGGVAEMLQTLLSYARGAGVDARWLVIEGDADFFAHQADPQRPLRLARRRRHARDKQCEHYERTLRRNADELLALVRPGDIVLPHDPQPAGLLPALHRAGAIVVWRCHVGRDTPNQWTERSWQLLRPYIEDADALVFSRRVFAPDGQNPRRRTWCRRRPSRSRPRTSLCPHETCG
jgi:trehalose synthase